MPYATLKMIEENDLYRSSVLNLQASENRLSPDVKRALSSDLASRYSHLMKNSINSYGGTSIFEEIYAKTIKDTAELFGSRYAEIRPVGGHIAVLAALMTVSRKGQKAAAIGEKYGGYPGYSSKYIGRLLDLNFIEIPFNDDRQEIEYDAFEKMVSLEKPDLVILGQSAFVKSYDLKRINEICEPHDIRIIYDGSHVMGLIAGGEFQPDVLKYSSLLVGSTHKSFFGPQGGIILTNSPDIMTKMEDNLTWMTMDNMHPNRIAALGIAVEEMKEHGKDYAKQLHLNSRNLGEELFGAGIPARFKPWYSETHQVLLDLKKEEDRISFSRKLEKNGIIVDRDGRIGTSEVTRMGCTDMTKVADLISRSNKGQNVLNEVRDLVKSFKLKYWRESL